MSSRWGLVAATDSIKSEVHGGAADDLIHRVFNSSFVIDRTGLRTAATTAAAPVPE